MDQNESDRQAFRPRGEASRVPDHVLEDSTRTPAKIDEPASFCLEPFEESTCRTCDTRIPANRRTCFFCLSEGIQPVEEEPTTVDESLLGVIFVAIDARTRYEAIAKGAQPVGTSRADLG